MKLGLVAKWYDLWIGVFWDRKMRRLYILPVPCLGIYIQFEAKPPVAALGSDGHIILKTVRQYHDANAVRRPEFIHIRGASLDDCPGCLYALRHGRTPFGNVLAKSNDPVFGSGE